MVVTITLNPAIDRTISLENLKLGKLNRAKASSIEIGGKGINVSRAIRALGGESIAMGLCAGSNGRYIKSRLTSLGIHHDFVEVPGQTRTNIKIIEQHGQHTDINEPGFNVSDADFLRLLERLSVYAGESTLFVLSGRVPPNMNMSMFKKLCKVISSENSKFIVDLTGEHLITALSYKPYIVKPNKLEISEFCEKDINTPQEALEATEKLLSMGAQNVCVSMSEQGAIFAFKDEIPLHITPCAIDPIGPVGAGDAMVGAIAHAINQNMTYEEMALFATAMGTASTSFEGSNMATLKNVFQIYEKCTLSKLG